MKNEIFDNLIKSGVQAMKIERKPDWQKMSSLIDEWVEQEKILSDQFFDQMIAERLNQSHVTYTDDRWTKFEKELNMRRKIKQRIIIFQLAGAAVVLLCAMLIYQLLPYTKSNTSSLEAFSQKKEVPAEKKQSETEMPIEIASVPAIAKHSLTSMEQFEFTLLDLKTATTDIDGKDWGKEDILPVSYRSEGNNAYYSGLNVDRLISYSDLYPGNWGGQPLPYLYHSGNKLTISITLVDLQDIIHSIVPAPSANDVMMVSYEKNEFFKDHLRDIGSDILQKSIPEATSGQGETDKIVELINKPKVVVSAYASPGMQIIRSPFDEVFNEPGYSMVQLKTGLGITAGVNYKKLGMNTGAEFSSLEYTPRVIEETIEDGKTIHLKKISVKSLKVPAHLNFDLFRNRLWQVYCKAGASLNIILDTQYDVEEKYNGLAYLIENLRTNPYFVKSLYSKKDFEPGLLDKGEFVSNMKTTVDLGIGVKRTISKDAVVYMEPMMHYDVSKSGFGPNRDKIHSMHLKTGIAFNIN